MAEPNESDVQTGNALDSLDAKGALAGEDLSTLPHGLQNIGNWADATDADMTEAGARGIKGRLPVDERHTPNRGNVQKRHHTRRRSGDQHEVAGDPEMDLPRSACLQPLNTSPQDAANSIVEPGEELGTVPIKELIPVSGILNELEDWALGPTIFVDRVPEVVGELLPPGFIPLSAQEHPKISIVSKWARRRSNSSKIIALQEMLSEGPRLEKALDTGMPGCQKVIDHTRNGVADSVILINKSLPIIEHGVSGKGYAAWAKIKTVAGVVGIMGVHGPRKQAKRPDAWEWIQSVIKEGKWILIGDLNMVERREDSIGPSPLLKGAELRKWTLCSNNADLIDTWLVAVRSTGPWFTRQAVCGARIDQARLDRCYTSERGEWIHTILQEYHQGSSVLSDHIPIKVTLQLVGDNQSGERIISYFKIHPKSMKSEAVRRERLHEGDAPTQFFFAQYRAKMAQERLTALKLESGQTITEEAAVFRLIHETFKTLYTAEPKNEVVAGQRQQVLQLTDKQLSMEQNQDLKELPSAVLIEETVRALPSEKAPGLDGVCAEVVVDGWDFMGEDCINMVQLFWRKRRLLPRDNKGVIKLIPKEGDLMLLKSWRPISLLTTTYKIIARIIAQRLKPMLPGIVDSQQTGFVAGRSIVENVLSLRLAQEWAAVTTQKVMFVRLDFQKAYDRVSYNYLWETLSATGLDLENIQRIQGLVVNGSASIHVNGRFTEDFPIQRGVRQGCPLAPLLFAISTQPLMRLLRREELENRLVGLNIGSDTTLLHQLYADDTGINMTMEESQFSRLQQVIQTFEQISGARLNLSKSLIMPLAPARILVGFTLPAVKLLALELISYTLESPPAARWMKRQLHRRSLGRACDGRIDALEKLCRHFLWGWSEQGNPKKALVSWERIAQPKSHGGLGWCPLSARAKAFNIKIMCQILQGADTEWVQLAKSFILRTLRMGKYQRERRQWSIQEFLLLAPPTKIAGSSTLSRIFRSWHSLWKKYTWRTTEGVIPANFSLAQVAILVQKATNADPRSWGKCVAVLRKGGITSAQEGRDLIHNNVGWERQLQNAGLHPEEEVKLKIRQLEDWIRGHVISVDASLFLQGWKWLDGGQTVDWLQQTKFWASKFWKLNFFESLLNGRWGITSSEINWGSRWKCLWGAPVSYRRKIWLWKYLQRGFFMGVRALEIGVDDGFCKRCWDDIETPDHCFWYCRKGRQRRDDFRALNILPHLQQGMLNSIDKALTAARRNPALLVGLGTFLDWTWRERNEKVFRGRDSHRPTSALLKGIAMEIEAIPSRSTGRAQFSALSAAKRTVQDWILTWEEKRRQRVTLRVTGRAEVAATRLTSAATPYTSRSIVDSSPSSSSAGFLHN
ncbi:hypothetical protein R1sor_005140 [Riccia sorocarpa]|uniref:Reverse transcriptase domain-containing protein n=1 Tax=Riccia sorocarpa TaxID=122646 RepID=A0ABD3HQ71_9MARC